MAKQGMKDVISEKKELRKRMLDKRMAMTEEVYFHKGKELLDRVMSLEVLPKAETVHCYIAMTSRREPETNAIIQELLRNGKKIVVPLIDINSRDLSHIYIDEATSWIINKWGVKEPVSGLSAAPSEIDLVLIPMLAGDKNRNRLGYGKGYYDTFLAKTSAIKAGLLFSDMLCDEIPTEPHDIPLDMIITEKGVI